MRGTGVASNRPRCIAWLWKLARIGGTLCVLHVAGAVALAQLDGPPAGDRAAPALQRGGQPRLKLTQAETAWVRAHPTVRVGFDGHFPPHSFIGDSGELEGFAVDIFALLSARTGLSFEPTGPDAWKDLYAAAQDQKVDVVATMVERPERAQWFVFTKPFIHKSLVIVTRKGDHRIGQKRHLTGKTVAVVKGYQYVDDLTAQFPTADIQYHDTMLEALNAVSVKQADAALTFLAAGRHVQTAYLMTNLEFSAVYDRDSAAESIAVRNDWPLLRSVLDKALASISTADKLALERRWLQAEPNVNEPRRLQLTTAEQAWIRAHPIIRLGIDPEFHPFEFRSDSVAHQGYAADYVRLLNRRLGLNMKVVPNLTWPQATAAARNRTVDVLPCVGVTRERSKHLNYTEAYLDFHRVIITRVDAPFVNGVDDLDDMRVAVQANSSHHGYLKEHAAFTPKPYPTLQRTLQAVAEGGADAMVGNVASATYWIRRLNLTNLKVAGATSREPQTLHFAVRKDWPILLSILQKGLAAIGKDEKRAISRRWLDVAYAPQTDYRLTIKIAVTSAFFVVVVLLWNVQIRRGRRRLTAAKNAAVVASRNAEAANTELRVIKEDLEDLVKRRSAELVRSEKMFQQAQKLEAMGTLVGGIAHDFNNVLAGMLGAIYLAEASSQDPHEVESRLRTASDLGFRGAEMVQQLLAYARKGGTTDKVAVEVDTIVKSVLTLIRTAVPKNVELVVDGRSTDLFVRGNVALLQQVLLNLVNNARDALADAPGPCITIAVRDCCPAGDIVTRNPHLAGQRCVRIDIRDNGSGMEPAALSKIFDPFFSTKAPGQGTGLGLSMVIGAVNDHQGAVDVDSIVGEGSCFSVYLPTCEPEPCDEQEEEVVAGAGQLVLIADDDLHVRQVHEDVLTRLNYKVIAVGDGESALAQLQQRGAEVQVAILDIVMPKLDGIATARQIRDRYPHVRVFFLSAYDFEQHLPAPLRDAGEVLLTKPCRVSLLSRTVSQHLCIATEQNRKGEAGRIERSG